MYNLGEPIRGILHSTDASSGVEVPLFREGSTTALTLASNEYVEVTSVELITVAGGDCYVLIGDDATLGTGETVTRGTFAANGGVRADNTMHAGGAGQKVWVVAPAGVVDVRLNGRIRTVKPDASRPNWRES